MNETIRKIVTDAFSDIAEDVKPETVGDETRLYGPDGTLTSIKLVMLIADIEEKIASTLGRNIILADEKAMSQKTSPFLTIGALTSYIEKLLAEEGK